MKVSLIVTTYNRPDALSAVLESVRSQARLPDETIVVDDGSDERTAAVVRQFQGALLGVQHLWQEHDGFRPARMRNWGIAEADGEYVVLIDGDMVLHKQFVSDHLDNAAQGRYLQGVRLPLNRRATAAFLRRPFAVRPWHVDGLPKVKYLLRSRTLAGLFAPRPHSRPTRIHSCNQSFWRDDLLEVNGFDERFHGFSGEDADLCARLTRVGVLQKRLPFLAVAYHLYHPPTANWSKVAKLSHASPRVVRGIDQHLPTTLPMPSRTLGPARRRAA